MLLAAVSPTNPKIPLHSYPGLIVTFIVCFSMFCFAVWVWVHNYGTKLPWQVDWNAEPEDAE